MTASVSLVRASSDGSSGRVQNGDEQSGRARRQVGQRHRGHGEQLVAECRPAHRANALRQLQPQRLPELGPGALDQPAARADQIALGADGVAKLAAGGRRRSRA